MQLMGWGLANLATIFKLQIAHSNAALKRGNGALSFPYRLLHARRSWSWKVTEKRRQLHTVSSCLLLTPSKLLPALLHWLPYHLFPILFREIKPVCVPPCMPLGAPSLLLMLVGGLFVTDADVPLQHFINENRDQLETVLSSYQDALCKLPVPSPLHNCQKLSSLPDCALRLYKL